MPGRPARYGTAKQLLDYFNLKGLDDLPTLMELRDIDTINAELELGLPGEQMPGEHHDAGEDAETDDAGQARVVQVAADTPESGGNHETLH